MTVYSSYRCPLSVCAWTLRTSAAIAIILRGPQVYTAVQRLMRCSGPGRDATPKCNIPTLGHGHLHTLPLPKFRGPRRRHVQNKRTSALCCPHPSCHLYSLPPGTPPSQVCFATLGRQMSDVDPREAHWWRGGWPLESGLSLELCSFVWSASCASIPVTRVARTLDWL